LFLQCAARLKRWAAGQKIYHVEPAVGRGKKYSEDRQNRIPRKQRGSNSRSAIGFFALAAIGFYEAGAERAVLTMRRGGRIMLSQSYFIDGSGKPLVLPSVAGSTAQVDLADNGTAIIEAPNDGALVQGYAAFTLPAIRRRARLPTSGIS
jgi:hypothetical protein